MVVRQEAVGGATRTAASRPRAQSSGAPIAQRLRQERAGTRASAPPQPRVNVSTPRPRSQASSAPAHQRSAPEEPPAIVEDTMPSETEQARNRTLNITEGTLNALSVGLTSSFLVAFALVLGASSMLVALLSTLPSLVGAFAQLGVQQVRRLFTTRRQHMFAMALIQALLWLPLLVIPHLPHAGAWLLLIVTLNAVAGFLISPVWNSFTADIVPENERGRFFGTRNTCTGIAAFLATLGAGLFLDVLKPSHPLLGFSILFLLAFAFRFVSSLMFVRMRPPPEVHEDGEFPEPHELLLNANKTPFGRFTLFLVLFNLSVSIASPFFAVYQLSILKFTYTQFTLLACASAIASFITMFIWGKYVDRIGASRVLVTCGLLIPLVPLGWVLTTDLRWLFLIEAFSGIVWAGFSLSVSTYIFDATEREHRTRQVAEYNLLVQVGLFIGAIIGSATIDHYGKELADSYLHVFFLSAALRFIIILIFYNAIKEQRLIEIPIHGRLFRQLIAVRPQQGLVYQTAVESVGAVNRFVRDRARDVEQMVDAIVPKRPRERSGVDRIAKEEYEKDFESYRKRLKKR